jgi:hypothetical protein
MTRTDSDESVTRMDLNLNAVSSPLPLLARGPDRLRGLGVGVGENDCNMTSRIDDRLGESDGKVNRTVTRTAAAASLARARPGCPASGFRQNHMMARARPGPGAGPLRSRAGLGFAPRDMRQSTVTRQTVIGRPSESRLS